MARIEAVCRRRRDPSDGQPVLNHPPFEIDPIARQVKKDGAALELTHKEFDVALLLFRNLGKVLSRGHIMEEIWGRGDATTTRTVDMHVSRVRQVLGLSAAIGLRLTAVYGYGYRLERTRGDE
jgi:DNA-binding response OmpR family regulator